MSLKEFIVDEIVGLPFKLFGIVHKSCMAVTLLALIFIFLNRKKIKNLTEKTKKTILKVAALIMLINMILFNVTKLYYGTFDYKIHLPFHLCFISGYLFMYGILFNKPNILKMTFFLSFIGPLPAMIFPELPSTFDSMQFYEYFFSHHFFMISSFFAFVAYDLKIEKKDVLNTFIFANTLFFSMMIFNHIFKTNYIFSSGIPEFILNMFPFIRTIHPIIILEVLGIGILLSIYGLTRLYHKEKK